MTTLMTESGALHQYAQSRSPDAFARLVALHADWVHAAALRMVKSRPLAEDVTQAVFLLLSQQPHKATGKPLAGWLFTVTRHCAQHALRAESRRAKHESRATPMTTPDDDSLWNDLSPRLDAAVSRLRDADRQLLLQRFYQNLSHAHIGQSLNISEDTARKRVAAALEKLRALLAVTAPAAALAALLSARTTHAAPPALKAALIAGAPAPAAIPLAHGAAKMILLSKLKTAAALTTAALLLTSAAGYTLWYSTRASAAPPAPPAPLAKISASAPAAKPAPDLSTPQNAFLASMAALKAGNRDALYRCLTADPRRSPTLLDAALNFHLAKNRLYAAADKRFGAPNAAPLRAGTVTIDMVGGLLATAQGDAAALKMPTPDSAELAIDIPPKFLNLLPNDFRETVQTWSNAPMRFQKTGPDWKFDIDHSMAARLITGRPESDTESQDHPAILQEIADATDAHTNAIPHGNFSSPADIARSLADATDTIMSRHQTPNFNLTILPYKSLP